MTGGITVYGAGYTSTQSNGNAAGLYYFWGASNCMTELLLDATGPRVLPTAPYEEAARALEVGVETAAEDPTYEDLAQELAEQFLWIARAMNCMRPDGMWDEDDGFRYDVLRLPDGRSTRLEVRSMVGLLPLRATTVIEPWQRERLPRLTSVFRDRLRPLESMARDRPQSSWRR